MPPVYKEALGITVGDIVSTSYSTGPFTVESITGPFTTFTSVGAFTIWPRPVICIRLIAIGDEHLIGEQAGDW